MKLGTIIKLAAVAGLVGISVWGYNYYQGIYELQYGFHDLGFEGEQIWVELVVNNPTGHTYPVPMLFFNVYDKLGNYYGVVYSNVLQWVEPGVNVVRAYLVANVATVIASLALLIVPGAQLDLMLDGTISIGEQSLKLQIPIHQTLSI
jgi:hypothetical protein